MTMMFASFPWMLNEDIYKYTKYIGICYKYLIFTFAYSTLETVLVP